jgi:VanZ family protein
MSKGPRESFSNDAPQNDSRGLRQALLATFLIAAPIEYAQGWVIGRYPDITDVALSLAGAWLGVRAGLSKSRPSGGQ